MKIHGIYWELLGTTVKITTILPDDTTCETSLVADFKIRQLENQIPQLVFQLVYSWIYWDMVKSP